MEFGALLLASLKDIAFLFHEEDIKFCLVGGLAVSMLSTPRATEDIDMVVAVDRSFRKKMETVLGKRFTLVQSKDIVEFSFGPIWRLILRRENEDELVVLDLLLTETKESKKALEDPIPLNIDGVIVPVASRKSLIAMKQSSKRPKDLADIEALQQEPE